ncbi:MAG: ABC-type uncharacterized transport system, periplasmic component [Microvirga sp.]|jgi:putative ABC transport system substrate-binding protein|nr:ABC-type uncharacterized transport system, periplasmic component [Microvirga sp.]
MKRLEFIAFLLGGAAVLSPALVKAQQLDLPVIGFLSSRSPKDAFFVAPFREGLKEVGYVEGQNVVVEYRWAENDNGRLPMLALDLVQRRVNVILAGGTLQQARAATTTIPIIFTTGLDPLSSGLVPSLSRPGGNVTGISFYSGAVGGKRLELLREVVPAAKRIGMLINPQGEAAGPQARDMQQFANAAGVRVHVVNASSDRDLDTAFMALAELQVGALLVTVDPFFDARPSQLVALASRYRVPAIYSRREFAEAGGLMSYGSRIVDAYRMAGVYAGRILKGEKPSELPVILPTKFEMVINLKAAKSLGLDIPPGLLAGADEVIE